MDSWVTVPWSAKAATDILEERFHHPLVGPDAPGSVQLPRDKLLHARFWNIDLIVQVNVPGMRQAGS
jgi:hypothetical protein